MPSVCKHPRILPSSTPDTRWVRVVLAWRVSRHNRERALVRRRYDRPALTAGPPLGQGGPVRTRPG
jgi:hypothetical protein